MSACKPPPAEKWREDRSWCALEKDALRQVDVWLSRESRNSWFVICAVEGYSINFLCSNANVNEYNWGKIVTLLEWKSRNSLSRFQRSLLRLVNCWIWPLQSSQVEFKGEILFYHQLNVKKPTTFFYSLAFSYFQANQDYFDMCGEENSQLKYILG